MTLELTTIKAVELHGDVYLVNGLKIVKTNHEGTLFELVEGGVHYYMRLLNKLESLESLPESKRVEIIRKIKLNVEELLAEVQPMI